MENELMLAADVEPGQEGMTDDALASLLAGHEQRSVGYYNSTIAAEQAKALNYYYGKMDDLPAADGCSSVVQHTVATMVDNGLAAILKPFVSAEQVVSFRPRGPEDQERAEQATEYVNYIIQQDNPGFQIFHDWFKDALLTKTGIVKVWWDDQTRYDVQEHMVDALQLMMIRTDPGYLSEEELGPGIFRVQIEREIPDGRVKVENVPSEEFLISPYSKDAGDAEYVAHKPSDMTRSTLIEMGLDQEVIDELPAYANTNADQDESRHRARFRDEQWFSANRQRTEGDSSRDLIAVLDEYVRVDYDGDGVSELRRVIRVDDKILFNEVVDEVPFATLCPIPMPHKFYGRSIADVTMESQKASTAILRQTLDNLYKTNNPRPIIGDRAVSQNGQTMQDVMDNSPGAAIRVNDPAALGWQETPFTAAASFPMLEYMAQQGEERSGVQRKGIGMNSEALKKNSPDTATQASIDENSRAERAELMARIFAETGVKRLFKLILKLVSEYQPKERVIRLRNEWVEMDPRGWPEMDLEISVGLGVGNKMEQIQQANVVLDSMRELGQTPFANLIDVEKVRKALARLFNAAGIKNVDEYLNDPAQMPPQEPQPDPEMVEVQMEQQRKTQQAEFDAQIAVQREQSREALDMFKAQREADLKQAKAEFEAQLAQAKAAFEAQLAREKMQYEKDAKTDIPDNHPGGDLSK